MAKEAKKLAEVQIGDCVAVVRVIVAKTEQADFWEVEFDDGEVQRFEKAADPAIEVEG